MKRDDKYTSLQVCRALKITKERMRDLLDRGFIAPTYASPGQGRPAFFTRSDVYGIKLFLHLVDDRKISRESASVFIKYWDAQLKKLSEKNPESLWKVFGQQLWFLIERVKDKDNIGVIPVTFTVSSDKLFDEMLLKFKGIVANKKWDDIIIVNMEKLIKAVDLQLETLQ